MQFGLLERRLLSDVVAVAVAVDASCFYGEAAFIAYLLGGPPDAVQRALHGWHYHQNHLEAMRSGPWKLHFPHGYRSMVGMTPGSGGTPGKYDYSAKTGLELYNLEDDISESRDVASEHPEVVAELSALADGMRARLGDKLNEVKGSENRAPGKVSK